MTGSDAGDGILIGAAKAGDRRSVSRRDHHGIIAILHAHLVTDTN